MLDGAVDDSQRALHRQQNRGLTLRVGALLALYVLDALVLAVGVERSSLSGQPAGVGMLRGVLCISLGAAAVVIAIVGLVRVIRDKQPRATTYGQTSRDLKQLMEQVHGKRPPAPTQLPLLRDVACSLASRRYVLLFPLTFGLVALGQGIILGSDSFARGLALFFELPLALTFFGVILSARETRAARRFLDEHPDSAMPETSLPA